MYRVRLNIAYSGYCYYRNNVTNQLCQVQASCIHNGSLNLLNENTFIKSELHAFQSVKELKKISISFQLFVHLDVLRCWLHVLVILTLYAVVIVVIATGLVNYTVPVQASLV